MQSIVRNRLNTLQKKSFTALKRVSKLLGHSGSTVGFLMFRYFIGIVSHPGVFRVSQYVSVESTSPTHQS